MLRRCGILFGSRILPSISLMISQYSAHIPTRQSQALEILDRRQGSGHQYTVFVDSTSAIDRVRTDGIGPGQILRRQPLRVAPGSWPGAVRSPSDGLRPIMESQGMRRPVSTPWRRPEALDQIA